jgi:hypothetical protein
VGLYNAGKGVKEDIKNVIERKLFFTLYSNRSASMVKTKVKNQNFFGTENGGLGKITTYSPLRHIFLGYSK